VFKRLLAAVLAAGLAASCAGVSDEPPLPAQAVAAAPVVSIPAASWRAVLIAGDNSSPAFDNGIDTLRERFAALGVRNITLLSASQARGARLATARAIDGTLRAAGGEACFVYMTSHGDESGFFLRAERRTLSPAALDQALSAGCGERPTVLVVSACHSGTFINAETRRPNRIIVAAAATDRTSFGCGADDDFTYYDQCFLQQLDSASTWRELAEATRGCVATLERRLGVRRESRPQVFVGAAVANLRLPGR
jgi:peptidase C13-like protein